MAEYLGLDVHVALSGYLNYIATEPVITIHRQSIKRQSWLPNFFYNVVSLVRTDLFTKAVFILFWYLYVSIYDMHLHTHNCLVPETFLPVVFLVNIDRSDLLEFQNIRSAFIYSNLIMAGLTICLSCLSKSVYESTINPQYTLWYVTPVNVVLSSPGQVILSIAVLLIQTLERGHE